MDRQMPIKTTADNETQTTKKISIVMGYVNRKNQLITTLRTISKSNHTNLEVIITDDGSSPEHNIDDILDNFLFPIKIIYNNDKENGKICNPCVAYNLAIAQATGDIIIIQNPERCHIGDILEHINKTLTENDYFTYSCFYFSKYTLNDKLNKILFDTDYFWSQEKHLNVLNMVKNFQESILPPQKKGWVNHPIYNKTDLHFLSAIYASKLKQIGGFDPIYKYGICFDDDDLLRDIKYKLQLSIVTIPVELDNNSIIQNNVYCIHQHHDKFTYADPNIMEKWNVNKNIFIRKHKKIINYYIDSLTKQNLYDDNHITNDLNVTQKNNESGLKIGIRNFDDIIYYCNGHESKFQEDINRHINFYYKKIQFTITTLQTLNVYITYDNKSKHVASINNETKQVTYEIKEKIDDIKSIYIYCRSEKLNELKYTVKDYTIKDIGIYMTTKYINYTGIYVEKNKQWIYKEIPKIMFTYWYGRLSYLHYLSIKSFLDYNPDWIVQLYYPKNPGTLKPSWKTGENSMEYTGKDWYDELKKLDINFIPIDFNEIGFNDDCNEIIKSDYLRTYILSTQGGLWSDTDIIYMQPMYEMDLMPNLIKGKIDDVDLVISFHYDPAFSYYSIGFLLASPNNEFFKFLLENTKLNLNTQQYQSIGSWLYRKLFPSVDKIIAKFPKMNMANIDLDFIYPFRWNETDIFFNKNIDFDQYIVTNNKRVIGIHWFNGSNDAKLFIRNEDYNKNVTVNSVLKKMLNYNYFLPK